MQDNKYEYKNTEGRANKKGCKSLNSRWEKAQTIKRLKRNVMNNWEKKNFYDNKQTINMKHTDKTDNSKMCFNHFNSAPNILEALHNLHCRVDHIFDWKLTGHCWEQSVKSQKMMLDNKKHRK